jgi:hypothetical protein
MMAENGHDRRGSQSGTSALQPQSDMDRGMSVMRCLADRVTPLPYVCLVPKADISRFQDWEHRSARKVAAWLLFATFS